MKKATILLFLLCASFFFMGCSIKDKTFKGPGFTITVTNEFKKSSHSSYVFCVKSETETVFANVFLKTEVNDSDKELSLLEYTESLLEDNGLTDVVQIHHRDSKKQPYYYLYYYSTTDGVADYGYMMVLMEDNTNFYLFNFVTAVGSFDENIPLFLDWASSITLK